MNAVSNVFLYNGETEREFNYPVCTALASSIGNVFHEYDSVETPGTIHADPSSLEMRNLIISTSGGNHNQAKSASGGSHSDISQIKFKA